MIDERLIHLLEIWDDLDWITRKRIMLVLYKYKMRQFLGDYIARAALWIAGSLAAAVALILLFWPERAGTFTMGLLLLAAAIGALGIKSESEKEDMEDIE